MSRLTTAQALLARLAEVCTKGPIVAPGVYDGISARTALDVGFDALYMTGAGSTASRLGQPDLAMITLPEMVDNARMIASLNPEIPLIADADTGFGGPAMVDRTVKAYERAGVAALHIEDQIQTKRCGHLAGKRVVSREEWVTRMKAACNARDKASGIVVIARTDSLQPLGFEEAVTRLRLGRSMGADMGLLEGLVNDEQARQVCAALAPWPICLNLVANGQSPNWTVEQATEFGFAMVVFSFASSIPAIRALRKALTDVKEKGTDAHACGGWGPKDLFLMVGLRDIEELDAKAGGGLYDGGV